MTALYDGWYQGAGQAALETDAAGISRVLLLSDGQANQGLTDVDEIARRCAAMAEAGVTTSTYGLGRNFNEDLMVHMARAGQGNHYYGQSAEDLMDPFREEFELLQSLCARRLRLALATPPGVTVAVVNDYPHDPEGQWRLPDLAYGGEAWAAVRLTVPDGIAIDQSVLTATLFFEDSETAESSTLSAALSLPRLAAEVFAAVASDDRVAERFGELAAAAVQEEARLAARRGDWRRVDALLAQAQADAASNPWLAGIIDALQGYARRREREEFSKEARYAARKLGTRLASTDEEVGSYAADAERQKAGFLRRKPEQGKSFLRDE
jgi:Ca-activated chloride channel family protein